MPGPGSHADPSVTGPGTVEFQIGLEGRESVSGLLTSPHGPPRTVFCFAHGAGAGMRHPFMQGVAERLAHRGVATLRYQFPYMEAGRRAPDRPAALMRTVRQAVRMAAALVPGAPLVAGGKSMGGRMTSLAHAEDRLEGIRGLVFFGFPLHPAGRASTDRGLHLADVRLPMLFLQGGRDKLADLDLLRPLLRTIEPPPVLHVLDGADHGFHVLKRSGRTDEDVLDEASDVFFTWIGALD